MKRFSGARFQFRITAFSPETIPMNRLAEYMLQLANLMGNEDHVHFAGVTTGSTVLNARVEDEDLPKVETRLRVVASTDAPAEIAKTYATINGYLRADNARATLRREGVETIVKFPGRDVEIPLRVGPIKEAGQLEGEIIRVGGKDRTIHATLVDPSGEEYKLITTSRDLARSLAKYLFCRVRVVGTGTWYRNEAEEWELDAFSLEGFEPVGEQSLVEAVSALRGVEGSEWERMSDPLAKLRELRRN